MRYIIEGRSVDKVLQENRIRISRGEIKVTPLADDVQKNCPAVHEQDAEEVHEEAPEQEAAPVVPEVPVTDEKDAPAEADTKDAPVEEDAKDVESEADTKEAPAEEDTKAAPKKSTSKKSTSKKSTSKKK